MKKKLGAILTGIALFSAALSGCSSTETSSKETDKEIPTLSVGYVFTNHQTPLMVAASKAEDFKAEGVYLKELVSREKYVLMKEEEPLANIDLVVNKSGSETMTMMTQGSIDMALASSAAFINAVDQGSDVKMLCPVHTEGIGLVMSSESDVNDWDGFTKLIEDSEKPVSVGYHSPTSAPLILFEGALNEAGISYTKDPENMDAEIMLVDLKSTSNLIPALTSKQVDAWVGPSPYPELAVTEGVGKIVLDMKNMPPEGKWHDFPCCVAGSTQKTIDNHPEIVENFVKLLTVSAEYSQENSDEAAQITADFTGVPVEAAKMSTIKYTTDPSQSWTSNLGLVYETLRNSDSFTGSFVNKEYEETHEDIFDFSFVKKATE